MSGGIDWRKAAEDRVLYFVDLEASSLLPGGYPIEVAWFGEDGQGESYLLQPEADWTEWSPQAEAVHGIPLALLRERGTPCDVVARRVMEVLGRERARVVSDAPGWDGNWLGALIETGDVQAGIRLTDVRQVYGEACRPLLRLLPPEGDPARARAEERLRNLAREIVTRAEEEEMLRPRPRHRALPDAEGLWWTWRQVQDAVAEHLASSRLRS